MAVPADVATHFIVIEAEIFGVFQVDFNTPASSDGQDDRVQGGPRRCEDQVIGLFVGVVQATTDHEPVASIYRAVKERIAGWPNQRASLLWSLGSSRAAASPGRPVPAARCLPPRQACIPPGWSERRPLHWQEPPARRRSPALPARAASRCCVRTPYRPPPS